MRLTDFIAKDLVFDNLQATEKEPAIAEIVGNLVQKKRLGTATKADVVKALMEREALGSTGIGGGFAVPHAKYGGVDKLVGVFARSKKGVNFNALDGEPVHLLFLLLSNQDNTGSHLEALALIARLLRDEMFRRFFMDAKTTEDLWDLLKEADERLESK
jgi:mannitol/fructose-specific phosphotransferase system IIA component (Ntr-type)